MGKMKSATILIADDHELLRDGIRGRLEKHPGWTVCAEAADGREAVELARKFKPDIAVLDIGMPELNGLEAAREIRQLLPAIRIIMVSIDQDARTLEECFQNGANAFVAKIGMSRLLRQEVAKLFPAPTGEARS